MNLAPVIVRELRAEARNRLNYLLRVLGAAALSVFCFIMFWDDAGHERGYEIFSALGAFTFLGILVIVPLMTADCISREKREGTIGLLFLTPLTASEIVIGKGIIHALRALVLIAATIPIIAMPFLIGGIRLADVLRILCLEGTGLALTLSAGFLASCLCRHWVRALVLAAVFCVVFVLAFAYLPASLLLFQATPFGVPNDIGFLEGLAYTAVALFLGKFSWSITPVTNASTVAIELLCLSLVVLLLTIIFAASRLRRGWQDNPPSTKQLWLRQTFCTPRFWTNVFRRWMRWKLARNPIGWLQQYSWSARLSRWGWCAVIIILESWFVAENFTGLRSWFPFLSNALLLTITFSAVSSFQREKQTGALELILVTPLQEKDLISGRLWGIWGQFLPAVVLIIIGWAAIYASFPDPYWSSWYYERNITLGQVLSFGRDFVLLPIIGLYFALRLQNIFAAWLLTCALYLLVPYASFEFLTFLANVIAKYRFQPSGSAFEWALAIGLDFMLRALAWAIRYPFPYFVTGWAARRLYQDLKNRSFVFVKG